MNNECQGPVGDRSAPMRRGWSALGGTRQGMMKRDAIKTAFERRLKEIAGDRPPRAEAEPLVVVLGRQVEDLKEQVASRDKQINAFKQLFVTYRYNAQQLGITPEQLDQLIPARNQIERGQS